VNIGQLELRAHGQLFDHELEVVVAGQRHDLALGVGHAHAQGGGMVQPSGPAWPQLIQWRLYVQELRAGDLRQADGGHVGGVAVQVRFMHW
jgi:hypothetical protein